MSQFRNILCPTDFSTCADRALRYAQSYAKESGGKLHVLNVVDSPKLAYTALEEAYAAGFSGESIIDSTKKDARVRLGHIVELQEMYGINAQYHIKEGNPWKVVSEFAEEIDADLIVVGTHGRSGFKKFLLGSTFEKLLRTTKTPLLSIKEITKESVRPDSPAIVNNVLCPIDFSDYSHSAIQTAADICREHHASLTLCHIVDSHFDCTGIEFGAPINDLGQLRESAIGMVNKLADELSDIETVVEVEIGIPEIVVNKLVDEAEIDLIVMATHGRSGFSHLVLGSMTEKVVRLARCPVLTIRPDETTSEGASVHPEN